MPSTLKCLILLCDALSNRRRCLYSISDNTSQLMGLCKFVWCISAHFLDQLRFCIKSVLYKSAFHFIFLYFYIETERKECSICELCGGQLREETQAIGNAFPHLLCVGDHHFVPGLSIACADDCSYATTFFAGFKMYILRESPPSSNSKMYNNGR